MLAELCFSRVDVTLAIDVVVVMTAQSFRDVEQFCGVCRGLPVQGGHADESSGEVQSVVIGLLMIMLMMLLIWPERIYQQIIVNVF